MNVAVLMTCHNRRETTLRGLRALHAAAQQVKVEGRGEQWHFDIFLNDDGSTDGTGEAAQEWYDSTLLDSPLFVLHLIRGSGSDFWAKGMERAWQAALDYEKAPAHRSTLNPQPSTLNPQPSTFFTHFLWLNDDAVLRPDSLSAALRLCVEETPASVVVGEFANVCGEIVYGKRGDLFTGNFVLVPRAVYEKIGMICGGFHHAWADSDYALRCKCAGVPVVSCGVVGTCEGHPNRPSLAGLSLRERWAMLWNPKGWCVHDLWLYRRRNWGLAAAIASSAHIVFHVLIGRVD